MSRQVLLLVFVGHFTLSDTPANAASIECGHLLNNGDGAAIDLDGPSCIRNGAAQDINILNLTGSGTGIRFSMGAGVTDVSFTGTYPSVVNTAPVYDVECLTADTCNFSLNATYDGQPVTLQVRKYL
ncbi:MAG: hypothetical protein ABJ059_14005, partial [Hyphomicrobiales bacterium]